MKLLLTATLGLMTVLLVSKAEANAQFSKIYAFPIEKYQALEAAIDEAAARPDMKQEFYKELDANDRSSIRCLDGSPSPLPGNNASRKGWGCMLTFATDLGSGITIELRQMLAMDKTTAEIRDLLSKENPNQKSKLELPRLFDGGRGSSYYCESVRGAWDCKLKMVSAN